MTDMRLHFFRCSIALLLLIAACNDLPDAPAQYRSGTIRGITIVDWSRDGYDRVDAAMLAEIRATGATDIAILTTAYQNGFHADEVEPDPTRTPSIASLGRLLSEARAAGLVTTLKPHIDPADGTWRAFIDPADPGRWFASYLSWLLPLASLADSLGCRQLIIGSELAGTVRHEKEWRDLVAKLRGAFRGRLIYAASWDEAFNVPFWDAVDAVGIDCYFPVTVRDDPGRFEILSGWQPTLDRIERLARQTGRPIVLTEVGYRSIDGAGRRPWEYRTAGEPDEGEQADLYWGMLQAIAACDRIVGLYIWNWPASGGGGAGDIDYTPRGKAAIRELKSSWRRPE